MSVMLHVRRLAAGTSVLGLSLAAGLTKPAVAQLPDKFENLKVLPKNIARDSLVQVMRGFTLALDVRCTFCHVAEPKAAGAPADAPERLNFKSDDKVEKRKARVMLRMVARINHDLLTGVPDRHDPPVAVQCVTCHRGSPVPETVDLVLDSIIGRSGVDSAIARYKELREDMVSGRYDFGESPIDELARRLAATGKTDAAISMLQMNEQYYPKSADIDFMLAELYLKNGDKAQAIQRYQMALARRPQDARAKRRLQELGASPPPAPPQSSQ
jgi:Photosynthetic reaction centre cytochrome C subunit/Tetratricopeptide repeat